MAEKRGEGGGEGGRESVKKGRERMYIIYKNRLTFLFLQTFSGRKDRPTKKWSERRRRRASKCLYANKEFRRILIKLNLFLQFH